MKSSAIIFIMNVFDTETRLGHARHGACHQGDWGVEEAVWGHVPGAEGGRAGGRGGQVSQRLGLSGKRQDCCWEREHTVTFATELSSQGIWWYATADAWACLCCVLAGLYVIICAERETVPSAIWLMPCVTLTTWGNSGTMQPGNLKSSSKHFLDLLLSDNLSVSCLQIIWGISFNW